MQTGGVATLHAEQRPSGLHDPPPQACEQPWPACDHGPAADDACGQLAAAEPDCHVSAARRPCAGAHACLLRSISPLSSAVPWKPARALHPSWASMIFHSVFLLD